MEAEQLTVVHDLFNRLHSELVSLIDPNAADRDMTQDEAKLAMIAFRADALHHDFTNVTLEGAVD